MNPSNASVNVASMLVGTDSANSASTKEATENDVAQVESIDDDIASFCRRHCTIEHEVGSSECGKGAADDSKSEAELVNVADTLKRAISERMRVIRFPSHRQRDNCSFVE